MTQARRRPGIVTPMLPGPAPGPAREPGHRDGAARPCRAPAAAAALRLGHPEAGGRRRKPVAGARQWPIGTMTRDRTVPTRSGRGNCLEH